MIISASYQATVAGLRSCAGVDEDQAAESMRRSVALASAARRDREALVAASIGPFGAAQADGSEYTGDYGLDEDALCRWHRHRFRLLANAGADLLAIETVPSLVEARALLRLLDESPVDAWFSFTCRDSERVADGTPLVDCIRAVAPHPRVAALGINCTAPDLVEPLLRQIAPHARKPLLAYPNSGETWNADARSWCGVSASVRFADLAPGWRDAGARLIGGCCRTDPRTIRALRDALC